MQKMKPLLAISLLAFLEAAPAAWQNSPAEILATPGPALAVRESRLVDGQMSATATAIVFNEKSHTLRVVDSPDPGHTKLAQILAAAGCIAGVNGGYFHGDYRPLGLVVADGHQLHAFEKAKLLSGILAIRTKRIEIVRSGNFVPGHDLRGAIQCGPMLVEDGAPVAGLNATRVARRTAVATDGRGRWALVYLTSVTLADTAKILLRPGLFGDWTPRTALNLDGGSSSGLWARASPVPVSRQEPGTVRNYLGVVAKGK